MNKVTNPHDSFFRETFGRKEIAASFLKEYLPAEILRKIDLESLTIGKDSFVEKELQHHFSDLLYSAKYGEGQLYLYFLFEHKSSPDPWVALQLLRYKIRIWELYRKQHPKEELLPAIVPLVLYHGCRKWRVAQDFRSLIAGSSAELNCYIPDFKYQLHDLSALQDDEIKGEVLGRITLLLLKHIFDPELAEKLPEILSLLQEVEGKQDSLEILEVLLRYVVKATKRFEEDELKEILEKSFIEEDVMQDFIDKYVEQGMQQGMQQGGGKVLACQLEYRFGRLPDWANEKIKKADVRVIEEWSIKVITASSIDEEFH